MRTILQAALATFTLTSLAAAQMRIEVTPKAGIFYGARSVLGGGGLWSEGPLTVVSLLKHRLAPVAGARLTAWTSPRFGLEIDASYTPSGLRRGKMLLSVVTTSSSGNGSSPSVSSGSHPPIVVDYSFNAYVVTGSARILGAVPLYGGAVTLHGLAGFGFIKRGGGAYSTFGRGTVHEGYVLGMGARFRLHPGLSFRMDAEDNLSSPNFVGRGGWGENAGVGVQHDFMFSTGLSMDLRQFGL